MDMLSRIEEILLLAIWKLEDNAYGISVREQVERDTGVTQASMRGQKRGPKQKKNTQGRKHTKVRHQHQCPCYRP